MNCRVIIYAAFLVSMILLSGCGDDRYSIYIAPVANAGDSQIVSPGSVVTLAGSASGDIVSYTWTLTSRPAGSNAVLSQANTMHPTFTADVAGTYIAELTVKDRLLNSDSATVTVLASVTTTVTSLTFNGSFESGLLGWSQGADLEAGAAGTCSYNEVVAPGTETLTGVSGFPATDGTHTVLGSVSSTSGTMNRYSCVLYHDVAIPAFTTNLVLTFDIAAKDGNNGCLDTGAFVGLYPTTSVPGLTTPTVGGTASPVCTAVPGTSLVTVTKNLTASEVAGTTVRLAVINSAWDLGHEVIGIDNISLTATVTH